jgi:hypothetical protein
MFKRYRKLHEMRISTFLVGARCHFEFKRTIGCVHKSNGILQRRVIVFQFVVSD